MPSTLHRTTGTPIVPEQRLAGLVAICIVYLCCVLPFASAQSQTTHFRTYSSTHSSTHYKSGGRIHHLGEKPHSLPSSVAPDVVGKPSGRAATPAGKELDQLERGNMRKPATIKRATSAAAAKSTIAPEKHSAPINFTHKELPQTSHSGTAKTR